MSAAAGGLERLFAPRSIAVIGASPRAGKAGNALVQSLAAFDGSVYPVHPSAEEVCGLRSYARIAEIETPVDLALLAIPAEVTVNAIGECAEAGVGAVVVHAGGFGEAGPDGAARQLAMVEAAGGSGMRLLGPNTSGFLVPGAGLFATFVRTAASIADGPLSIVAQSGGVNHALAFTAEAEGIGVRLAVGLGNAADVSFADVLDHLAEDPGTGVVALAVEGLADGRRVVGAVERLVDRVPVVALVLGRGDVGDFAQSHTGALAGDRAVTRAALRQAGAVLVDDTATLIDAARALATTRLPARDRVGVGLVTGQAGPGLLLADALAAEGVATPPLAPEIEERLRQRLGGITYTRNPVDTGRPGPDFGEVLSTVSEADGIDLLAVYLLDEPDAVDLHALFGPAFGRPAILGTAGIAAEIRALRDSLAGEGVVVLPTPERVAAAVAALARDAAAAARRAAAGPIVEGADGSTFPAGRAWDEASAKDLLGELGIGSPQRFVCEDHAAVLSAQRELDRPVVLKLLHPALTHKTDLGAVKLGLQAQDLALALGELDRIELPAGPRRYLVEAMVAPGPELLVGAVRDPSFGPMVLLGAGGTEAEALGDVTARLAPLSLVEAASMLDDLDAAFRYRGFRAGPVVDEQALAMAIASVAAFLLARPEIAEIEVNPLRVSAAGLVALDALIVPERS
jgi:acetyltransferase